MTARIPPPVLEPFVDTRTGLIRRVWYDFLQNRDGATSLIDALASGKIWIGSASNLPAAQTMSGDATLSVAGALSLATVNANVGSFGSSTQVSQVTVNGKGLTTAASSVAIAIPSTQVTDFTEAAQDAVGAMVDTTIVYNDATPVLTRAAITGDVAVAASSNVSILATVNANIGTFGSSTRVASVTVSSKGLVTAVSSIAIAIPSTQVTDFTEASQDATGAMVDATIVYNDTNPLLTRAAITGDITIAASSNASVLATVNSNIGTFGSATVVPQITVSSKGLVTSVSSVTIAITSGAVTDFTEAAQDAVGAMVDATLIYNDAGPLLTRAALTGDITVAASSNASVLATVNSNIGTFGSSTRVAQVTVSSKGLVTAVSSVAIVYDSANFTGTNWTDLTDAGATTLHKHDHGGLDGLADDDHTIYYKADGTRAGTGDHDFSGATSLKIPVSSVPTMDADGKIALDTSVTSWVHGLATYRSTSTYAVLAMPFGNVTSIPHGNLVSYTSSAAGLVFVAPTSALTVTVANEATDTSCFINFTTAATGDLGIKSNANLTFNSNTGVLTSASAVLTTADINGGTLDGVTIGGASAAGADFTSVETTDNVAIGGSVSDTVALRITGTITTTSIQGGVSVANTLTAAAVNDAIGISVSQSIADGGGATFTSYESYIASNVTKSGAGDTLTEQSGFYCSPLTTGSSNYGFRGRVAAAANRYNCYMDGTAQNYFAGDVVIGTNLLPDANDGAVLGAAGTAFSDLFLAEGAVINWDSGDATLTQTGNVLALAGAVFTPDSQIDLSGAASGQIKFPATQNASADANTLDDYEEGTWTPTLTTDGVDFTSVTYDAVTGGRYTKIGNLVHIQGSVRTDAITVGSASGNLAIGGLPFTAVANTGSTIDGSCSISIYFSSTFVTNQPSTLQVLAGGTLLFPYYRATANGATVSMGFAEAGTGANANRINFGGTYIAA